MDNQCKMCGYRISADTALRTGAVSWRDYDTRFALDPTLYWCRNQGKWIKSGDSCPSWVSCRKRKKTNETHEPSANFF
jgi:hypothetical protein